MTRMGVTKMATMMKAGMSRVRMVMMMLRVGRRGRRRCVLVVL